MREKYKSIDGCEAYSVQARVSNHSEDFLVVLAKEGVEEDGGLDTHSHQTHCYSVGSENLNHC